jgi:GNAT superfamily N-acetyltransferase
MSRRRTEPGDDLEPPIGDQSSVRIGAGRASERILRRKRGGGARIISARPRDVAMLPAIELAAARLLVGHAPGSILNETTSLDVLNAAQRHGRLWVALADDVPVGFAHVELLEPAVAHLEEIDVRPDYGHRGLGKRLVTAICTWAAASGYESVTLTTFRDVPWNMPFYARLGFEVIPSDALSPALRAVVQDEARRGLDPSRRVAMRRRCAVTCSVDNSV